ncbi:hypothetical protein EJB05_44838, partial [Eragrostis curvula]
SRRRARKASVLLPFTREDARCCCCSPDVWTFVEVPASLRTSSSRTATSLGVDHNKAFCCATRLEGKMTPVRGLLLSCAVCLDALSCRVGMVMSHAGIRCTVSSAARACSAVRTYSSSELRTDRRALL